MEETVFDKSKRIAKGAGITFAANSIGKLLTYLYRLIIARAGAEFYGIITIGILVSQIGSVIASLGFGSGIERYVAYFKSLKDNERVKGVITFALKLNLIASIIIAALGVVFAEAIAVNIFKSTSLIIVIQLFSLLIPVLTISNAGENVLRGFQRVSFIAITKGFAENLAKLIFTFFAIQMGFGLVGMSISYIASIVLSMAMLWLWIQFKTFPIFKTKIKSKTIKREFVGFSFPLLLMSLIGVILGITDSTLLGFYNDVKEVGYYNAAMPTAILMGLVSGALLPLFVPIITEMFAQKRFQEVEKLFKKITKWQLMAMAPIALSMIIFPDNVIDILFPSEYTKAASALVFLAVGQFVLNITLTSQSVLTVWKKTHFHLINTIAATITNVLLNFMLIPQYGMVGAAIASMAAWTLFSTMSVIESFAVTKMHPFSLTLIKPLIASLAAILIIQQIYFAAPLFKTTISFILLLAIYIATYAAILVAIKAFDKEDKQIINLILNKVNAPFQV